MTGATLTVSRGTGVSHQVLQAAVLSEAGVNKYYTITELTREFGISTRTLRFYEDEGLIHPERRGRTRLFRSADRRLIMEILRGRRIGFTIAEIREIIQVYKDPPGEAVSRKSEKNCSRSARTSRRHSKNWATSRKPA
jgi:DNA-binding transcriptional MerR regulator